MKLGQICFSKFSKKHLYLKEKDFSLFDVYSADEAFVTGSFGGLTPVTKIDGRIISEQVPMPKTKQLEELYKTRIKSEMS